MRETKEREGLYRATTFPNLGKVRSREHSQSCCTHVNLFKFSVSLNKKGLKKRGEVK